MSDETNTATPAPETPSNVVTGDFTQPETPAAPASSPESSEQPAASAAGENPAASSDPAATPENTIDLDKISHEDVVQRLIDITKKLTFELLLNLKLHEHINLRDAAKEGGAATAPETETAPEAPAENAEADTVVS